MIVHIVMFKFKDEDKSSNIEKVKDALNALPEKIDELNSIEVGVNFADEARAFDLSLYSTFDSLENLKVYATHSEHLKVIELIKSVTVESKVVDYEI